MPNDLWVWYNYPLMEHLIDTIVSKISFLHLNVLLVLGLALFGGTIGGRLFQKIRVPQVVGYLVIGILLGQSGLNLVNRAVITSLAPVNYFALGLIAFMVGGELRYETLSRYGKQFVAILLGEGLGAFFVVATLSALAYYLYSHDLRYSIALGILLGAIASATDAASTINVLWEYKAKGILTTTTLGIVALDDGLSFLLFSIASSVAGVLVGKGELSLAHSILHPLWEIFGSIFIGLLSGWILVFFLEKYTEEDKTLTFLLGGVLITLGLSISLGMDMLLAAMSLGVVLTNALPRRSQEVFSLVEKVAPPIYVLFFVLVGAKLKLSFFSPLVGVLVVLYIVGRTLGKMFGAYLGIEISRGSEKLKRYLWKALFCQASAAIGLSILAAQVFPGDMGGRIVAVITLTTFVLQLIGPSFVKQAIEQAGEAGLNISEDDLKAQLRVEDVMDTSVPFIRENMGLSEVVEVLQRTDHVFYPVVDKEGRLKGVVAMENVKNALMMADLGDVLVAHDLMDPPYEVVYTTDRLVDVYDKLMRFEFLPVLSPDGKVVGILDYRQVQKVLSARLVKLSERAYD